jgi:hypothetical protein
MYTLIIKELPDFDKDLPEDQVLSAFAPIHLVKNSLSKLFMLLKQENKVFRIHGQQSSD